MTEVAFFMMLIEIHVHIEAGSGTRKPSLSLCDQASAIHSERDTAENRSHLASTAPIGSNLGAFGIRPGFWRIEIPMPAILG
jgi:hypothetical protein